MKTMNEQKRYSPSKRSYTLIRRTCQEKFPFANRIHRLNKRRDQLFRERTQSPSEVAECHQYEDNGVGWRTCQVCQKPRRVSCRGLRANKKSKITVSCVTKRGGRFSGSTSKGKQF